MSMKGYVDSIFQQFLELPETTPRLSGFMLELLSGGGCGAFIPTKHQIYMRFILVKQFYINILTQTLAHQSNISFTSSPLMVKRGMSSVDSWKCTRL